jgi:oligopeptidase A
MPYDLDTNPLLALGDLPRFESIRPEHIAAAIDTLLAEARAAVDQVGGSGAEPGWDTLVEPLDDAIERLARAWGTVSHLNAVVDTPTLRAQYNLNLPKLSAFWTELSQDARLYRRYKALAAAPAYATLSASRRRVIDNELRDFRLGGAELDAAGQARLRQIREQLSATTTRFAENVLDATQHFSLTITETEAATQLAGMPPDAMALYRESAAAAEQPGLRITLQSPSYWPAMQYAPDRTLRETLYHAYTTRASEFGKAEWDNSAGMLDILRLRREQAQLLGYRNYAELSLVPKMAQSPDEVLRFLRDLARRSHPFAERDMAELKQYAAQALGLAELTAWDVGFASEKLREARYAYSQQELKPYFPEPVVLAGLYRLIEALFDVVIKPDAAPVWHPDVRFYRIESRAGSLVGQFYLDLYARDHKQGGAWQDDARGRRRRGGTVQTPVSYLTCNFSRPLSGKPALFTHDEVLTLFHEFGHGLHHMLTRVDELAVAGIRGVEWDAVELPSQFLENFAWEWDVLQMLTAHVDSGASLPRALFDRMIAARNFQSGMAMARQLEYGLIDMRLHVEYAPDWTAADVQRVIGEVRREVSVVPVPPFNRVTHGFTHIFSGGYAAGYYSYKWAEVLSADAYAAFEEAGRVLDAAAGKRFADEVLAVGGSRPALQSFVAFRGRPPSIDPLLRHSGLTS